MSYTVGFFIGFAVYLILGTIDMHEDAVIGFAIIAGLVAYGLTWIVRTMIRAKYGDDILKDKDV